jgi:DNA-directed RNA polymerase specialized sigma24 family protein
VNTEADLKSLHLHYIRSRCAEESKHFSQRQEYDPRFCYELFRRAILNRDQRAWEYVYQQYQRVVASWVGRHPLFYSLEEDEGFFVNRVFEKMWKHLTPEKFMHSPSLNALLSYLHKCVNSVLVDAMRKQERFVLLEEGENGIDLLASSPKTPESEIVNRDIADRLWALLQERCKDEKEVAIAYGSFVLALKASQIYSEYRGVFQSVKEVYRVKEKLLARLKRDQELLDFLENS